MQTVEYVAQHEARLFVRPREVHVQLKVHCGCGKSFDDLQPARDHAMQTGHVLHVVGDVRPVK